jgi:hypothetical protein
MTNRRISTDPTSSAEAWEAVDARMTENFAARQHLLIVFAATCDECQGAAAASNARLSRCIGNNDMGSGHRAKDEEELNGKPGKSVP